MRTLDALFGRRPRAQLSALLKVQAKLTLREPYGVGMGLGFPVILLVLFGVISQHTAGNVAGSGLTVIDLYIPTIMVISFVAIAISLPNTLVRDREMGWLRRISTTPVHPSRLLAAPADPQPHARRGGGRRPLGWRHCHLRCAAPRQCPVLHHFARARSRDDLLAGIGCRRLGADTDYCQCRRRGALLQPAVLVRAVGPARAGRRAAALHHVLLLRSVQRCGRSSTRCSTRPRRSRP